MDNLRNAIDIIFCRRSVSEILKSLTCGINNGIEQVLEKRTFKDLWQETNLQYSGDQLNSLYAVMTDNWIMRHGCRNVFNILDVVADGMLTFDSDEPVCKYEQYLRWHELSALIGEDILTCRFLASNSFEHNVKFNSFAWKPVLTTNNHRLEQLFRRGLSELHFHFRGSSLTFDISWMSLMNELTLYKEKDFRTLPTTEPIKSYVTLAALLRLYLFVSLNGFQESIPQARELMDYWLNSPESLDRLILKEKEINNAISIAKKLYGHRFADLTIDYAIPDKLTNKDNERGYNILLTGERKLLYDCFYAIESNETNDPFIGRYLYLYLVLKLKFRNCLIQRNKRIGFENFQDFEGNKMVFVKRNPIYQELIDYAASNITIENQNIEYIEYRIPPKESKEKLLESIEDIERNIHNSKFTDDVNKKSVKYGYVIHFIKKPDTSECYNGSLASEAICRHQSLREKLQEETNAIAEIVAEEDDCMIVGIDAANSEFNCRAEVYAQSYRKLRNIHHDSTRDFLNRTTFSGLGLTYHVGEDFYDVADGLRAIEEAILFLELNIGDRLGHAIAMGIDVQRYYDEKHFTTILPQQNLVDNLAWLLHKSEELGLQNMSVNYFLKSKFDEICLKVYDEIIPINVYIQGWMLRGDSPKCYRVWNKIPSDPMEQYLLRTNAQTARSNIEARKLMHRYHYDSKVKQKGKLAVEFKIEKPYRQSFVQMLEAIQEHLQTVVSIKKISIETNLTSNRRICNIDKYSSHPIVRFYNEGLEFNNYQVRNSEQLSVSINTDDQGIFATSLEKEYTLMALAMEKWVDSKGMPIVKEYSIYRWLENIRDNAVNQRFKQ